MDHAVASDSLGARLVSATQMAVAMHVSMDLLSKQSPGFTPGQQAMIGGADRCVTDDAQPYVAGEIED